MRDRREDRQTERRIEMRGRQGHIEIHRSSRHREDRHADRWTAREAGKDTLRYTGQADTGKTDMQTDGQTGR